MAATVDVLWIARYDYEPGWKLQEHQHDFFQAIHALAGDANVEAHGRAMKIGEGKLWLIPPGTGHAMRLDEDRGLRTLDVKFQVSDPALRAALSALPPIMPCPEAEATLERIRREGLARRPYFRHRCGAMLLELLIDCIRRGLDDAGDSIGRADSEGNARSAPVSGSHLDSSIDEVCQALLLVIENRMATALTGPDLASLTGYSYSHLDERSRAAFGATPLQLLMRKRIEQACRLMRYSDWELKRIAAAVGFKSIHHFTRRFTELVGRSPAAWRRAEREGVRQDVYIDERFTNRNVTIRSDHR